MRRAQSRRELEAIAADLVRRLGGVWRPGGAMCLCPAHDDRDPSLSVRFGHSALLFKCFAGCDTIDVLRAIARIEPAALQATASDARRNAAADEPWLLRRVQDLWTSARPLEGTAAALYLRKRSIALLSPALRFHPRTPLGPRNRVVFRPALIAAVHDGSRLVAVQRTFLDAAQGERASDLVNPRRMLGRPGRGAVKLVEATDTLGLAEGVETALSAMILLRIPVWAVLGNERFARIAVPDTVRRLILLPDNDRPGRMAAAAAAKIHQAEGRVIERLMPWHGLNDWNDVQRSEGKGEGGGTRLAA